MSIVNIVLAMTATTTALIAGLFYAYSCSVNPGLGRLPDPQYIAAMQSINRAIQNPVFFSSFMGTVILLTLSSYLHYTSIHSPRFLLLLAATVIYVTGSFGVTVFGNVPLNEALDAFDLKTASIEEVAAARTSFEGRWNNLHIIRTLASIISLVLVIIACQATGSGPDKPI